MAKDPGISWTDHTFNPWWGCTKVGNSPACDGCYAERLSERHGLKIWGNAAQRRYFGETHWNEPLNWNGAAERAKQRKRVFCMSMGDWAEGRPEQRDHLERLWELIQRTPWLDWLMLTKRPQLIPALRPESWHFDPPPNVWLGTTAETQACLDLRWPLLKRVPAAVYWLSIEPLLEPITLPKDFLALGRQAWCIVGGESGPQARPMSPDWARHLRDQCIAAGVPFHFKQWGEWSATTARSGRLVQIDTQLMLRVGKKKAGRVLDGREWDEVPTPVRKGPLDSQESAVALQDANGFNQEQRRWHGEDQSDSTPTQTDAETATTSENSAGVPAVIGGTTQNEKDTMVTVYWGVDEFAISTIAAGAEIAQPGAEPAHTPTTPAKVVPIRISARYNATDFIQTYVGYADVLEVSQIMHEAVAVQIIASVLNKNGVSIPHGPLSYPLDLWIVLLSRSGAGRNTLVTLADPLLEGAKQNDLVCNTRWGSAPALYQQMAENPTALFVWGELSEKLKLLADPRFGGVKQWLTDRYDSFRVPESVTYRETQNSQNTPPIIFATAPRMNILATSSAHWFFNNLTQEDSAGGFVPRWLLVYPEDRGRLIPTPLLPSRNLLDRLIGQLLQMSEIRGQADLTEILPLYEHWYVETKRRFDDQPNAVLANAYFNRHRAHVLKLAVIYEVSRSLSLRPNEASWKRAARAAKHLEETIFSLLGTGMNKEGFAIRQMEDKIKKAGADGLPLSELTRAFQHDNRRTRAQRLQTLLAGEAVLTFQRQTAGRSAIVLVHSTAAPDYQLRHPEAKQRFDL